MAQFDLIIFDCDGTLTDTEAANNQATLDILAEEGLHYTLEHAYQHWMGKTVSDIVLSIQMETGKMLPADIGKRYVRRAAELLSVGLDAVEGAPDLVSKSAAAGFKICVASNGERSNVLRSLTVTNLLPFFGEPHVFTKNQVKRAKPHPDLFLFAASSMGVEPDRCLVIEDSATGVLAGRAAKMEVWGFTGTAHAPENRLTDLKSAGANRIFSKLIHMADLLGL